MIVRTADEGVSVGQPEVQTILNVLVSVYDTHGRYTAAGWS